MQPFPAVEPIPLPAPVWLFKTLHNLTLSLHFVAVQLLVGGLALALLMSLAARLRRDQALRECSGLVAQRLPIVMAYVINLGIPPLLFSQVLYGRALYTSSILIGFYWLGVIFLVMAAYFLLYRMAYRMEAGRTFEWLGLLALLLVVFVARIYSTNMTLMLRPEAWVEMYRSDPYGLQLVGGDPTITPRWLYMMLSGLTVGGVATTLLGCQYGVNPDMRARFERWGLRGLVIGALVQLPAGPWVLRTQPGDVQTDVAASPFHKVAAWIWFITLLVLIVLAVLRLLKSSPRIRVLPVALALAAYVNVAAMVIVRDGIRDVTLRLKGFDVWQRTVFTNWSVVILFFILFVLGLIAMGWMISVVARAKETEQPYG
ncbi:MAG: hypothetical protein HY706_05250 [Candidatus Hydrogenedentes bacterium]|nr:hypothetical protein [Candidatus Hydrogenedentota bacterium]